MGADIYKNKKALFVLLVSAFLSMVVFLYYPFFQGIINSFKQIPELGAATRDWNEPWYTNYVEMFTDENMWAAMKNTLTMMVVTIAGQMGIAIVLVILVDNIKGRAKLFRTMYFSPIVISATAFGLMFNLIFLYDKGMLNQMLEISGVTELIGWKGEKLALLVVMFPVMWQYAGFCFITLITGLNNVSGELYEAAFIDGATRFQCIHYISLPMIYSVICTCVVLGVTDVLKVFDLPWTMFPKGMPPGETWLTGTYMYYQTFNTKNIDYSPAIVVLIVVLGAVTAKVVNATFKEKDYQEERRV